MTQILDDSTPAPFAETGFWNRFTGQGFNNTVREAYAGTGATATWTFQVEPGTYRVSTTWSAYFNRTTVARYAAFDGAAQVAERTINQQLVPSDLVADGTVWQDVGTAVVVRGTTLSVRLTAGVSQNTIADAVRVERVGDLPPPSAFVLDTRVYGFTAAQAAVVRAAADRWQRVITGDLPDATFNGLPGIAEPFGTVKGVLVDFVSQQIDGAGNVLGDTGVYQYRADSSPVYGRVVFDTADVANLEASGGLFYVALHEIGHVLGFGGPNWVKRLLGTTGSDPRFVGPLATAEYNARFGRSEPGVPVEAGGGSGTALKHWRESVFTNELMTGYLNAGANPVSRVTVAALADMGYAVDMNAADPY